jgi:hypothetical protein
MSVQDMTKPARRPVGLLVVGVILLVLAVIGIVLYATGAPDAAADAGTGTGALRGLTIWGAALCGGTGLVLVIVAMIKRGRATS